MAINTTFNPLRIDDFERDKLNFDAKSVKGQMTTGTATNLDLVLADDYLLTGAWLIIEGATLGDTISFQIIDSSGAYTGVVNTVIAQYVTSWAVPKSCSVQLDMVYSAKIYAGLGLRIVYTSIGNESPFFAANYKLHKVLA
jgi:hypothetical protein